MLLMSDLSSHCQVKGHAELSLREDGPGNYYYLKCSNHLPIPLLLVTVTFCLRSLPWVQGSACNTTTLATRLWGRQVKLSWSGLSLESNADVGRETILSARFLEGKQNETWMLNSQELLFLLHRDRNSIRGRQIGAESRDQATAITALWEPSDLPTDKAEANVRIQEWNKAQGPRGAAVSEVSGTPVFPSYKSK